MTPHKAQEEGWPVVKLSRHNPSQRPSDMSAFPNCVCGCQTEGETYLPQSSIQGLVGVLEEIADNSDDPSAAEEARKALASYKQEVG